MPSLYPRKPKVYVAGPYSQPDPCANTREAIAVADLLWDRGFIPFVPHLSLFWNTVSPKPYEDWLAYDRHWVAVCDAVYRFRGKSAGADKEVVLAESLGIPVFRSIYDLCDHFEMYTHSAE